MSSAQSLTGLLTQGLRKLTGIDRSRPKGYRVINVELKPVSYTHLTLPTKA